mmetsp:Transcript_44713/g.126500  ORF Transcript_44713/g.126500 Transcript_44713/m.126500 type:complete len:291 (-) Transcript_44713:223-1095(-)
MWADLCNRRGHLVWLPARLHRRAVHAPRRQEGLPVVRAGGRRGEGPGSKRQGAREGRASKRRREGQGRRAGRQGEERGEGEGEEQEGSEQGQPRARAVRVGGGAEARGGRGSDAGVEGRGPRPRPGGPPGELPPDPGVARQQSRGPGGAHGALAPDRAVHLLPQRHPGEGRALRGALRRLGAPHGAPQGHQVGAGQGQGPGEDRRLLEGLPVDRREHAEGRPGDGLVGLRVPDHRDREADVHRGRQHVEPRAHRHAGPHPHERGEEVPQRDEASRGLRARLGRRARRRHG